MTIKFAFSEKDVKDYLETVQTILPEYPYTDARSIAEFCYVHCDSSEECDVNRGIHHYYEVFNIDKPSNLSEPSY